MQQEHRFLAHLAVAPYMGAWIEIQGNEIDTTNIIIVYSNTGSHILGGRPNEA